MFEAADHRGEERPLRLDDQFSDHWRVSGSKSRRVSPFAPRCGMSISSMFAAPSNSDRQPAVDPNSSHCAAGVEEVGAPAVADVPLAVEEVEVVRAAHERSPVVRSVRESAR